MQPNHDHDFTGLKVAWGAIIHGRLEDILKLKQLIKSNFPELKICYQRTSLGRLWIVEKNQGDERHG